MSEQRNTQNNESSLLRDLSIPIAIVIAGAFIGIGLFMSGQTNNNAQNAAAAAPSGTGDTRPDISELIPQLVTEAGVDRDAFQSCFDSDQTAPLVQEDIDNAVATGGQGTPWSIVVGPLGKTYPLNGAVPITEIERVVALARAEAGQGPAGAETDAVTPVTEDDHLKGNANASVTIIEYSDYDCPFCSRFHMSMNSVVAKDADLAWVYRHMPLEQLHPNAPAIARAAECVAELGGDEAFWTFTDGYFEATS